MLTFERKRMDIEKLAGMNPTRIINAASKIIGNPIVLFDICYNLLANTEGVTTDDPLWNELVTNKCFSHETVDFFNTENFIISFSQSEIVAEMKSPKLKYDRMNGKIFNSDGIQTGDICVVACKKPFEEGDAELIRELCGILKDSVEEILSNGADRCGVKISPPERHSFFADLLEAEDFHKPLSKTAAKLYNELKTNLYLAVADTSQYESTVTHLAYFRDLFRGIQDEYKYFVHSNYVVIIISIDDKNICTEKHLKGLSEFFARYRIFAGISEKFSDLNEVRKHYQQAINALNYGVKSRRNQNIYFYDNYKIERFLSQTEADTAGALSPTVYYIKEYDAENPAKPYLYDTLYFYLLYGLNSRACLGSLGIKEEELAARLKILEEDFGIEWINGEMLSSILFSMKLLDKAD